MAQHDGNCRPAASCTTRCASSGTTPSTATSSAAYPGADDGATLIKQINTGDYRLPTFEMFERVHRQPVLPHLAPDL